MIKHLSAALIAAFLCAGLAHANSHKEAPKMASADCEKQAGEKKLHGAAKNSFVKKCSGGGAMAMSPAAEACSKQATEKKLAGAAKNSFTKKCMADAK